MAAAPQIAPCADGGAPNIIVLRESVWPALQDRFHLCAVKAKQCAEFPVGEDHALDGGGQTVFDEPYIGFRPDVRRRRWNVSIHRQSAVSLITSDNG